MEGGGGLSGESLVAQERGFDLRWFQMSSYLGERGDTTVPPLYSRGIGLSLFLLFLEQVGFSF